MNNTMDFADLLKAVFTGQEIPPYMQPFVAQVFKNSDGLIALDTENRIRCGSKVTKAYEATSEVCGLSTRQISTIHKKYFRPNVSGHTTGSFASENPADLHVSLLMKQWLSGSNHGERNKTKTRRRK